MAFDVIIKTNAEIVRCDMYDVRVESEIEKLFLTKKVLKNKTLREQIRENKVPRIAFKHIAEELHLKEPQLANLFDISLRTLSRREKYLVKSEADKLYRVARILYIATLVLGDKEFAVNWLKTPKIALNNETPLSLLDTQLGANEVEDMLMRIEYGVYM